MGIALLVGFHQRETSFARKLEQGRFRAKLESATAEFETVFTSTSPLSKVMTRATALISFGVLTVLAIGCEESAEKPEPETVAKPKAVAIAEYPVAVIDIGDVIMEKAEQIRTVSFEVKNTGTAPLKISKITKSCKCSKAEAKQTTVAPGESTTIEVGAVIKEPGAKHVKLNVDTNSSVNPYKLLQVRWVAVAPYEVDTKEIDFGKVTPDSKYELKVGFSADEHGVCSDAKPTLSPRFKSEQLSARVADDGAIMVTLVTGPEPGKGAEELEFSVDGCWKETLNIPVRWEAQPPVSVKPDFVFANDMKPGEVVEKQIVLSSVNRLQLVVETLETDECTIEWKPINKSRLRGTIRFTAPTEPGRFNRRIQIPIKEPKSKPVVLSIAGSVSE